MARLRFGVVSESVREGRAWLDFARQVEDRGIDVLLLWDHFSAGAFGQQLAPFSGLAAAAAVTTRLRVGTIVLSNDFRHPAIVAHEAASLHLICGGRFELGIGAGWYQPEYAAAGIAFDAPGQRIARLAESLTIIKGLLAGTPVHQASGFYRIDGLDLDVLPAPRPGSPRLLVGAGGPRMLRLAARHADIVGVLPAPIRDPVGSDDPRDRLPAAFDAKIGVLRAAAGDRFANLEINAFGTFIITGKRRANTADLIVRRGWADIDAEAVWQMPTIFIGSPDQIRSDLQERRSDSACHIWWPARTACPSWPRLPAACRARRASHRTPRRAAFRSHRCRNAAASSRGSERCASADTPNWTIYAHLYRHGCCSSRAPIRPIAC